MKLNCSYMSSSIFTKMASCVNAKIAAYLCGCLHVRGHRGHSHWRRGSHHPVRNRRRHCIRIITVVVAVVLIITPVLVVVVVGLLIVLLLITAVIVLSLVVEVV